MSQGLARYGHGMPARPTKAPRDMHREPHATHPHLNAPFTNRISNQNWIENSEIRFTKEQFKALQTYRGNHFITQRLDKGGIASDVED